MFDATVSSYVITVHMQTIISMKLLNGYNFLLV